MRKVILIISFVGLIVLVPGCFPTYLSEGESVSGFFMGVWHGWIAPISLIAGVFDSNIRIYEPNNSGWWYDFGFYIAIIAGFGGFALRRKKDRHT